MKKINLIIFLLLIITNIACGQDGVIFNNAPSTNISGLITQSGANNPTVIFTNNGLDTISFYRASTGIYYVQCNGRFGISNTTYSITNNFSNTNNEVRMYRDNDDAIFFYTYVNGILADGLLNNTPFQITITQFK